MSSSEATLESWGLTVTTGREADAMRAASEEHKKGGADTHLFENGAPNQRAEPTATDLERKRLLGHAPELVVGDIGSRFHQIRRWKRDRSGPTSSPREHMAESCSRGFSQSGPHVA